VNRPYDLEICDINGLTVRYGSQKMHVTENLSYVQGAIFDGGLLMRFQQIEGDHSKPMAQVHQMLVCRWYIN
jgi:hypothetical protein